MPEEVGISLVVLIVAGWVLFKLIAAFVAGINQAHEDVSGAYARRVAQRFAKRRLQLAQHVQIVLPNELERAEQEMSSVDAKLREARSETVWTPQRPVWEKRPFLAHVPSGQSAVWQEMDVAELNSILCHNSISWLDRESAILTQDCTYQPEAPKVHCLTFRELSVPPLQLKEAIFEVQHSSVKAKDLGKFFCTERKQVEEYNHRRLTILLRYEEQRKQIQEWNAEDRERWERYIDISTVMAEEELSKFRSHAKRYSKECNEQKKRIETISQGFRQGAREEVIARVQYILSDLVVPISIPRMWNIDFDQEQQILIVEIELPDVVHRPPIKTVLLKTGRIRRPLNQTERKEYIPKVHPAILLRLAYELFRNDNSGTIKLLVLNGWVNFDDPKTGINTRAYTASLMLERSQMESMNLRQVDPLAAFQTLKGKSAGKLIEIIPIEPTLNLKRADSRFVDAKAVLSTLDGATNLAGMNWQDFEHLIRELFEKEFVGRGAEVKITQASRDRGVDAIAFNPDPIHGGKYVIQAKRYTNTVDVSAVRDLCAVVRKEGASRGILVTTSTYGADAYAFANNEPVTLLNGAELLGLLSKHGYSFRINLQEARKLKPDNSQNDGDRRRV